MIVDLMLGTVSLRTVRDGVDVKAIAEAHQGGGHPRSAGFQIPIEERFAVVNYLLKARCAK